MNGKQEKDRTSEILEIAISNKEEFKKICREIKEEHQSWKRQWLLGVAT